jgi:ferredoxin
VAALTKRDDGPVVYNADICIGCRYCMVACPYQIPAYEYHNALTPKVMKCTLCPERTLDQGKPPACVEICPREALVYGKRSQLLELAHERIKRNPERYHPEVYGEHAVGGTSWLMLSDRPVTELGIPELPNESPAVLTESIQHGIFKGFTGPLMIFGLVGVLMKSSTDKCPGGPHGHEDRKHHDHDGEDNHG